MRIDYSISNEHAEKFISLLVLGVLYSIEKAISIDEAEGFIFKPSTSKTLNAASHSKNLIDIIDSGCELEDISSIIPENLSGNIDKLINQTLDFIRGAPDFGGAVDKEIILVK
ncbi:DUF3969 family protein [Escherichia coli]|uniref:DUF3969 family protein n=1 Tax=Escherichia coli TaxID=562 RepID=UPI00222814B2|nr:DUF3969 family protein [Escherichia coli]MCW3382303.1 DUF3969 family protein [Escherichia coli]